MGIDEQAHTRCLVWIQPACFTRCTIEPNRLKQCDAGQLADNVASLIATQLNCTEAALMDGCQHTLDRLVDEQTNEGNLPSARRTANRLGDLCRLLGANLAA